MDTRTSASSLFILAACLGCAQPHAPESGGPPAPPIVAQNQPALPGDEAEGPVPALSQRRIIFHGTLDIEVRDFEAARSQLNSLLKQYAAFLAKTEIHMDSGEKRVGSFTIRVPVEHFQNLMDALAVTGNPLRNATDSSDVTEEYVDMEARVKNLKAEEEVLNRLLKDAGSKLDELFRIRQQIVQNREQIERAEGRLRLLADLSELSTITLTLRDHQEFVPATAAIVREPPAFKSRATETFSASLQLLRTVVESCLLCLIALAPWSPALLILGFIVWKRTRRGTVLKSLQH